MKKSLTPASVLIPAAQYLRMSTEHQRFSPDNQKAVIAAYAEDNGYEIVETYLDAGKSGLTLTGRPALKRLLADVLTGGPKYSAVLVLDVSRWGRFQDADQAAHYEFLCRQAGVPVRYCSEAFSNDGGAMASIVKHMKRVMAAEYSRDLSIRIARAQRQQARLGYKQGGTPVLGTRRRVVDENGAVRMYLTTGQRKGLATDRVTLVRGPKSEVDLVQRIFAMYVLEEKKITDICRWLTASRRLQKSGQPWNYVTVAHILRNEIYTGIYVFGKRRNNLGNSNWEPASHWSRASVMEPIISSEMFQGALERRDRTTRKVYTNEQLLTRLARLFVDEGIISFESIRNCPDLPGPEVFVKRFGSLRQAGLLIGHNKPLRSSPGGHKMSYSDDQLIGELRRMAKTHGAITQRIIDQDPDTPPAGYFVRRLGGIFKLSALAGIDRIEPRRVSPTPSTFVSSERLLERLTTLFRYAGYLTEEMINADPTFPSSSQYKRRFGGMLQAYALVGFSGSRSGVMKAAAARKKATA